MPLINIKTGHAIRSGDIVHYHGKPYTLWHADERSGYCQLLSCDDGRRYRTVYPRDIAARWQSHSEHQQTIAQRNAHVNPVMREVLGSCFR